MSGSEPHRRTGEDARPPGAAAARSEAPVGQNPPYHDHVISCNDSTKTLPAYTMGIGRRGRRARAGLTDRAADPLASCIGRKTASRLLAGRRFTCAGRQSRRGYRYRLLTLPQLVSSSATGAELSVVTLSKEMSTSPHMSPVLPSPMTNMSKGMKNFSTEAWVPSM
jgi:hypothetical protein